MLLNKETDRTNTLKYNSPYKQYKCPPLVHNIHFKPNVSMCECERVLISFLIRYHLEPYFHKNKLHLQDIWTDGQGDLSKMWLIIVYNLQKRMKLKNIAINIL